MSILIAAFFAAAAGYALGRSRRAPREEELDETRRRLDEATGQLSRREADFKTLQEVTDIINAHPGQPGILAAIVSMVAKSLVADVCAFLLLDDATGELVTQPGAYGVSDDEASRYRVSLKNDASSSVRAFLKGEPFLTDDAQADPRAIGRLARLWKVHSLIVVPLKVEGRRIGVLRVGSHKKAFFNEGHLRLVTLIAEEAAVLVEGAVMSQKLADMGLEMARLNNLKDDFVSTVSHEFKTPLTSIKGFIQIMLEGEAGPLNADQRRFLTIVREASERLGLLVSDLLDISRLENGVRIELGSVAIEEVARRSIEAHAHAARQRGVRLALLEGAPLPPVRGDAQWLGLVFDNLLSNALKFTLEGGEVGVSAEAVEGRLRVCVSDSGVGIPSEDLGRIFDKFYRADNRDKVNAPGTGLGLAICKSVIDKHEGRIWAESSPGSGSRFFFEIPFAAGKAAPAAGQEGLA